MTHPEFYLQLPLPPSVNSYWGFHGSKRFLTPRAKEFKWRVHKAFYDSRLPPFQASDRLAITISLHFKDKRTNDLDNRVKSLLDALTQAKVFPDDSQIDKLHVCRGQPDPHGASTVFILPIRQPMQSPSHSGDEHSHMPLNNPECHPRIDSSADIRLA